VAEPKKPRWTVYNGIAVAVTGVWALLNIVAAIDPSRPVSPSVHGIFWTVVTAIYGGGKIADAISRRRNGQNGDA